MNPVYNYVEENGQTPLPRLIDEVCLERIKIVKICQQMEHLRTEAVIEDGLAYHVVEVKE
ncbi:MAG: hypothetical protein ABEJ07_01815 [Candidatus Nanohaloarchaea archaeon]